MFWLISLIATNIFCYFLPFLIQFSGSSSDSFQNFLAMGWKSNREIASGEYYRLLTSTFLHGDEIHLLVNMYSLWSIGGISMSVFGTTGFGLIYFLSGLGGSLASFFFNANPSVGASGAIFGLVGALLALGIQTNNFGLINSIFITIVINVAIAFLPGSRLDNWGHLGGILTGFVVSFVLLSLQIGLPN